MGKGKYLQGTIHLFFFQLINPQSGHVYLAINQYICCVHFMRKQLIILRKTNEKLVFTYALFSS